MLTTCLTSYEGENVNAIIAAVVGVVLSGVTVLGGVSAYQGGDPKPIKDEDLYTYADR